MNRRFKLKFETLSISINHYSFCCTRFTVLLMINESGLTSQVLVKQTHRMEDVVEAAAGGEAVVGVDPLQAPDGQEHSNRRAEGKESLGVEAELWVINRHLQEKKPPKNKR